MSIENAVRNRAVLLESIGKAALNVLYPTEFEVYVVAFELIDADGNTLRYFIFPVNPSNLEETSNQVTNVKKTLTGVTSLMSPTFVPIDITLAGSFGRKFKVLLGTDFVQFINSFRVDGNGKVSAQSLTKGVVEIFSERVKTGYGCYKILEEIVNESIVVDEKGPRRLIFYNLAFGNSYLVKPMALKTSMSQESNMIHNYHLTLKALAPITALNKAKDLQDDRAKLNATALIQSGVNRLVNELTKALTF